MGFKFKDRTVKVEVDGKEYAIQIGSAEMADRVAMAYTNLEAIGGEKLASDPRANMNVSNMLRNLIGAILGQEAQDEIFAKRQHSVIDEIELLSYLMDEVNKAEDSSFSISAAIQEVAGMMGGNGSDVSVQPLPCDTPVSD